MVHVTRDTRLSEAYERVNDAQDAVIEAVRNWYRRGGEAALVAAYQRLCKAEAALRLAERGGG